MHFGVSKGRGYSLKDGVIGSDTHDGVRLLVLARPATELNIKRSRDMESQIAEARILGVGGRVAVVDPGAEGCSGCRIDGKYLRLVGRVFVCVEGAQQPFNPASAATARKTDLLRHLVRLT